MHFIAVALGCAAVSLAAAPGLAVPHEWNRLPRVPHSDDDVINPRPGTPVGGLHIGRQSVEFERTSWSDLERSLGPMRVRKQGDAASSEDWTCLSVTARKAKYQVWLHSGELQGGDRIDGVTAQEGSEWPISECPIVRARNAILDNGLWVGSTKSALRRRLGRPSAVYGSTLVYDYEVPVRDQKLGNGSITGRMIFEMRAGRVHRLLATKDTSY